MTTELRSMTGFARVRKPLGESEVVVTVKSVNHRALDLHVQGPQALDAFEPAIRSRVKEHVARGHVEVRVSLPKSADRNGSLSLNREMLDEYLRIFAAEAAGRGLESKPDLNIALRIPGMLGESAEVDLPEGTAGVLDAALLEALGELNRFRAREGAELAADMRIQNGKIATAALEMDQLRDGAAAVFQKRLTDRLKELLNGAQIDPHRLAQEAAILADRSDIGEELARLRIHSGQLALLLDAGGEAGKKLDFLLQEMNRETNTILSKTSGVGDPALKIGELALAVKACIEKIREQSLNLE